MTKLKKTVKQFVLALLILGTVCLTVMLCINTHVKNIYAKKLLAPEEAVLLEDVDCILILGCGIWDDGVPSPMLEDRLAQGTALYESGAAPKLLMSGDHGRENYDEVKTMKYYAMDKGIPSEDIFMDHAGFSTYESMVRAKEIFEADKIIIVTQGYHLYRALYDANRLGIDAYGVASDSRDYGGQIFRDVREIAARNKDFLYCLLKPAPTFLGETIPISGSGNLTNDENFDKMFV